MNIRQHILIIGIAFTAATASAISPSEAADSILTKNKIIRSANYLRQAKDLEAKTYSNLPDPEIEGEYLVAPSGEENRWGVGINYELEWPGVYAARRKAAKMARESNYLDTRALIHDMRLEIYDELWAYLYADRRLTLLNKMSAATDSIRSLSEKAMRGGEMSRLDLSKIAIEQSRIKSMIANIENDRLSIKGRLTTLNGGEDCDSLLDAIDYDWAMTPLMDRENYHLYVIANDNSEILKVAKDELEAESRLGMSKAERLPGFKVGYAHAFEDGLHFNGANLGLSIPLFSSRNKVKAAKAMVNATKLNTEIVIENEISKVDALYDEIVSLDKSLETPTEIFSHTDYTDMLMKAYKGGELSLTEYLVELSWFYEAHLEYMELQYRRESKLNQIRFLSPQ